jgi:putative endonuclease
VGATTNLTLRLERHFAGIACRTTRRDRPLCLVYEEPFDTYSAAVRREIQLEGWTAAKKEALVVGDLRRLRRLARRRNR